MGRVSRMKDLHPIRAQSGSVGDRMYTSSCAYALRSPRIAARRKNPPQDCT